ncbi:MAG: hypothetical protein Q7S15_00345 [bacterium]|nr:hypothetical protein [bacterium]
MRNGSTLIKKFRRKILYHYRKHKRNLPWRETTDPYKILVSEVMLQQTHAEPVVAKCNLFDGKFSSVRLEKAVIELAREGFITYKRGVLTFK